MFYKFFKPNCDNVCAVTHNELYASSPLDFNDPFEGHIYSEGFGRMSEITGVVMKPEIVHLYQTRRFTINEIE